MMTRGVLYIGGDESNYSGRKKEHNLTVYTCIFSGEGSDSTPKNIPSGRTNDKKKELARWFDAQNGSLRDFRFALIDTDYTGKLGFGVTLADMFPYIVKSFIKGKRSRIERMVFQFDGDLSRRQKDLIYEEFPETEVDIVAYPKKMLGGEIISHPQIVDAADIMGHIIFRELGRGLESAANAIHSPKRVVPGGHVQGTRLERMLEGNEGRIKSYLERMKGATPLHTFI